MNWKKRAAALMLAAMCLLSACDAIHIGGEEKPVDNVKVSGVYFGMAWYQNGTLNPVTDSTSINKLLSEAMYEGLFTISSNFTPQNVLCAEYEGDGTSFTFTLRDDVTFWSGEKLTASDVVASLQAARFSETSPYHNRLTEVSSIEAVSDYEVRIHLSSPNISFPRLLDIPIYREGSADSGSFADGTGPFQPVKENEQWMLKPNEDWHGGFLGTIRNITLVPVLRADAAESSFQTGDVSIMRKPRIAPEGAATMVGGSIDTVRTASAGLHYLGINHQREKLANAKVRQALSAALDRQGLCDTQLQTYAVPTVLPVSPQPDSSSVELSMAPNMTKALALLREGLYGKSDADDTDDADKSDTGDSDDNDDTDDTDDTQSQDDGDDADDTRSEDDTEQDSDGDSDTSDDSTQMRQLDAPIEMSLRLLVNANNAFKVAAAEQIAASWKALGISVTVDKQPYESYLSMLQSGDFDVYYGETLLTPDFDLRPLLSPGGSLNYGGYASDSMTNAIAAVRRGDDLTSFYSHFIEEMPLIPIGFECGQIIIRKGLIQNFSPAPYNAFAGQQDWTMPE